MQGRFPKLVEDVAITSQGVLNELCFVLFDILN